MDEYLEGIVERIDANLSRVRSGNNLYNCEIRKKLFRFGPLKTSITVGDTVSFKVLEANKKGVIEEVLPRRNKLSRRSVWHGEEKIIAANIDQLVTVSAAKRPRLSTNLIDRYLVVAEKHGFDAVVCVNKMDLADEGDIHSRIEIYESLGYPVVLVSALQGDNLDALKGILSGRNSILAGHSGAGKSSLINAIIPDVQIETREISRKWKKGKHTTTAVSMFHLPFGGYIIDTPGIREFGLWDVRKEELSLFFREFTNFIGKCRYKNCVHLSEPDCAVKEAVANHEIDERRYKSYIAIYESIPDIKPRER